MATLNITAQKMKINLDRGVTFDKPFWILSDDLTAIDLTNFGAVIQIKEDYSDTTPLFELSIANGKIAIVTTATLTIKAGKIINGVELDADVVISNVQGIKPILTAEETASITQDCLVYASILIDADGNVRPHLKGVVTINESGVTQ